MQPFAQPARRIFFLPYLAAVLTCVACVSERTDQGERINHLVAHGQYDQAVRESERWQRENPGDRRAQQLYQRASVAWLLEQGRRATLADKDLDALEAFKQAREIDPDAPEVLAWIGKTNNKISERWLNTALELHANDDLEPAAQAYQKALEYAPHDQSAINGLASATLQLNFRAGRGIDYFNEGLHAFADYWLEQARSRFSYSGKYLTSDQRIPQRRGQVEALLADQRVALAQHFEQVARYAAARNEYRLAAALDPQNEAAKQGLERCGREARAAEDLRQARMAIVRGRLEDARTILEKGRKLTQVQLESFDGAVAEIQEAALERLYRTALALERDFAYEQAVQKYGELLSQTQYYKDVLTRKETLEEYIRLAGDLYEKVQAAPDDDQRLELLQQIRVFWPEYKDIKRQIEKLEASRQQ